MEWKLRFGLAAACAACLSFGAAPALAITLPQGFEDRTVQSGFEGAAAFDYAPDGRIFVAEKPGVLKVITPAGQVATVLDISDHVNSNTDRGLLGLAVDSAFEQNGFVFLLYVYEDQPLARDAPKVARLARIRVLPDSTVANPASPETVIVGRVASAPCPAPSNTVDCIPADGRSHVTGTVRAAPDGTLFVGTGDATFQALNTPDPYRPYDEHSYAGKILHVDRNGNGLPGHAFCPGDADLTRVCTKVFGKGFRNPFRFTVRPDGESVVVGDVGDATEEEVDVVRAGGNYGWPCYEGNVRAPRHRDSARCQEEYAKEATGDGPDAPVYSYPRGEGAAVIAGPTYPDGGPFPREYHGSVFVGDFVQGWIRTLRLDGADRLLAVEPFATEWAGTDINVTPEGQLAYTPGWPSLQAISFADGNRAPVARVAASATDGRLPLTVQFTGDGSTDADGDPLTYEWDFGDGTPGSEEAGPSHTYEQAGTFVARLTVTDEHGATDSATIAIAAGNERPTALIDAPDDEASYRDGEPVALSGSAVDPDDGDLPGSALRWRVRLHHNTHVHEFDELTGASPTFTPVRSHDADSFYEITLTARDSGGLERSTTIELRPETVAFGIDSQPPGAPVAYDGSARSTPFTTDSAVGFDAAVSTARTFQRSDKTYVFERWSDGGELQHTVRIPAEPSRITAVYREQTLLERLGLGDLEKLLPDLMESPARRW